MTPVDVTFFYELPPGGVSCPLNEVRDVYGIRQLSLDAKAHVIRVEYDASRLTRNDVEALLREDGLGVVL